MKNALEFVRAVLATVMILVSMFFPSAEGEEYTAKNPDEARLVFNTFADVHVETNNPVSYTNFKNILDDAVLNESADANVFLGDNIMNGQITENFLFFSAVKAKLDTDRTFIAVGNHDVGNGEGDYNQLLKRFKTFHNLTIDNKMDEPYYYRVVDGYYFIFISPENLCVHSLPISDEQIQWLRETLALAGESGKPIFVFSHHPLYLIEKDNQNLLYDILNDYTNIYHIYGHTHWSFNTEVRQGIPCINIPRVVDEGFGMVVEVYDNEVIFRERNFIEGKWYQEVSFPITK